MKRLFDDPLKHTASYTDAEINKGLNYLINDTNGGYDAYELFNPKVPLDLRKDTVAAIFNIFAQIFQPRCLHFLEHLARTKDDKQGVNPLNAVCYMWWDIIPFYGKSGNPDRDVLDEPCLQVMEKTLALDSIACQESALHGLGHWHMAYPERVETIIDAFLKANPKLDARLRAYADAAHHGAVL